MVLIMGRAISGLGAAGLVSGATTIFSYCVALKDPGQDLAQWSWECTALGLPLDPWWVVL
jgi:hypothetical protein